MRTAIKTTKLTMKAGKSYIVAEYDGKWKRYEYDITIGPRANHCGAALSILREHGLSDSVGSLAYSYLGTDERTMVWVDADHQRYPVNRPCRPVKDEATLR